MDVAQYEWSDKPVPAFKGEPSRRLFNKYNGDQVLFIINYYSTVSTGFTSEKGKQIAYKMLHHLPQEIKSEIAVFNWVRELFMDCIG